MTTHQDTSTEREALKQCPFCGKTHTLKITTAQELSEQDSDYDGEFWQHSDSFAVICDASSPNGPGGCGASGGFFPTEAEAVAAWQRRAALASRDEAAQQPQGQAVSDEQIIKAMDAADEYARCAAKAHAESLYGTSKSYTAECARFENEARAKLQAILALRPDHFPDAGKMMQLSDDFATIAGLESAVGHLSTLVDEQRALLVESEDVFGRDGHGGKYEDGECELIDRIRSHLDMTAPPPNGITAKEQGNGN